MEKFIQYFVNIVTILTFVILCIQVCPDWYKKWRKEFKIKIQDSGHQFEVFIKFCEKFTIQKIIILNKESVYFHDFHPYNGTFLIKTGCDISNYHHLVVKKDALKVKIENNKIDLMEKKIRFKAIFFTESGEERTAEFSF